MFNQSVNQQTWPSPSDPLRSAVQYLASLSPRFNWVGIYLLKGNILELGPYVGATSEHTRIPVGKGICGLAVQNQQDLNIPNIHQAENYLACSVETQSELVVLIRDPDGKIVGQIDIDSHSMDAFGVKEEEQVRQVAQVLGENWPSI